MLDEHSEVQEVYEDRRWADEDIGKQRRVDLA